MPISCLYTLSYISFVFALYKSRRIVPIQTPPSPETQQRNTTIILSRDNVDLRRGSQKEEFALPYVEQSCRQTSSSDGIPEPLDPLNRRNLALVESPVESAVEHGQDADQDDRKDLRADGHPQSGTARKAHQKPQEQTV